MKRIGLLTAIAIVWGLVLLAGWSLSVEVHMATFILSGSVGVCLILNGAWRHKPQHREIWFGFAACASLFVASFSLRFLFPDSMATLPTGVPRLPDYCDLLSFGVAVATMHQLARLRDESTDPTTVIDSCIVAGGLSTVVWLAQLVPVIEDRELATSGRFLSVTVALLSIWLAFCAIRLTLTSPVRNASSTKLVVAALFGVMAEMSAVSTTSTITTGLLTFGSMALVMMGLAAAEPSMSMLTAPPLKKRLRPSKSMTTRRVLLMTVALLIAPGALLFRATIGGGIQWTIATCLILSWAAVTALVMIRIAGIVRAKEQIARGDRAISHAASALVVSPDILSSYESVMAAMLELVVADDELASAFVVRRTDDEWIIVAAKSAVGVGDERLLGRRLATEGVEAALADDVDEIEIANLFTSEISDPELNYVFAVPLVQQKLDLGALILLTSRPVTLETTEALKSLASNLILAVEASTMAESLHQRRSEERFRSLIENSTDIILVVDNQDLATGMSPAGEWLLGAETSDLSELLHRIHEGDRTGISEMVERTRQGAKVERVEFRVDDSDEMRWFEATCSNLMHDSQINGVVFNARDITERKALEHDLRHKVLHDDLTGISNRVLFRDRLDHALNARRNSTLNPGVAVMFIDIDDFKTVNDGLGHDTGDELLKEVAIRLSACIRPSDTASRLGGDEFAILLEDLQSTEAILEAAGRVLTALVEPIHFGSRELNISASIGVALSDPFMTSEMLLRNADVAMYHAKRSGKGRVEIFDEAMYVSALERLELKGELLHALERNEFLVHYQPIVRLNDRQLVGYEALVRWMHPTRGLVPPTSFIPLAEENGLIADIGAWVLREACLQLAVWRHMHQGDLHMSVNVSPSQLRDDAIIGIVKEAIEISGIEPNWLTLELTESAGLEDPDSQARLVALRDLGCAIAADDFGTGFATYAALQHLPFTTVKIDRSLIAGLSEGDERASVQVRSIIRMGHALGLRIIAEGIEDARQADTLVRMKADWGQGFLTGRPVTAADAAEYLSSGKKVEVDEFRG